MPINNVEFLKKYRNEFFVETGTFQGETVQLALNAGFTWIRSVELNSKNYQECCKKFFNEWSVLLYHGSAEEKLWEMIRDINRPITFWLDAHYSGCGADYVTEKGRTWSSILSDLAIIGKHPLKCHTILVDDRRDFGTQNFDFVNEREIIRMIKTINPNYKITYDTGSDENPIFKNDVLVAQL